MNYAEQIPREAFIFHVLECAYECAWDAHFPEEWQDPYDDWDFTRDTKSWNIDCVDETTIELSAEVKTTYTGEKVLKARYNPPGKAHPAEYETCKASGWVHIRCDLETLGLVTAVEIEVYRDGTV